jgi:hypothetical protein
MPRKTLHLILNVLMVCCLGFPQHADALNSKNQDPSARGTDAECFSEIKLARLGRSIRISDSLMRNKRSFRSINGSLRGRLRSRLGNTGAFHKSRIRLKNNFKSIAQRKRDLFKRRLIISESPRFQAFRNRIKRR